MMEKKLRNQINNCKLCNLCKTRTNTVFGGGNFFSDIFFVGEAPGKDEDIQGLPFVGRAGKFLNSMLESINLSRDDVFITNIVKCRPPENRDPKEEEIKICSPFLFEQIKISKPKIIVTLGRYSMNFFLPDVQISNVHGNPYKRRSDGLIIFPMYHPAVALYRASFRDVLFSDMKKLQFLLNKLKSNTKYTNLQLF